MSHDRNASSFHERFRDAAQLSFGPLKISLEQTDGEQKPGEVLQSTVWTAATILAAALQERVVPCAGANVVEVRLHSAELCVSLSKPIAQVVSHANLIESRVRSSVVGLVCAASWQRC